MPEATPKGVRMRSVGFVTVIAAALIAGYGYTVRAKDAADLQDFTDKVAVPTVAVTKPVQQNNAQHLQLPGRMEAFRQAPLYARVDGYLAQWHFDIGSHVNAGDLIAVIDTPDIDQQLMQARADLNVAEANATLAESTAKRWQTLAKTKAVSVQEAEENVSAWQASLATVESAKAEVSFLEVQKKYARILAPFSGVVTHRATDEGDLISAGSNGGDALFEVADVSKIRVYVRVPQNFMGQIKVGTAAKVSVPERPEDTYEATVYASAGAVDESSGTTLMQIIVDNPTGELLPGAYAMVNLDLPQPQNVYTIPASAIIFDASGLSVATVNENNHVTRKPVIIARDLGRVVEIRDGLTGSEQVITNPPDGVRNDDPVRVVTTNT